MEKLAALERRIGALKRELARERHVVDMALGRIDMLERIILAQYAGARSVVDRIEADEAAGKDQTLGQTILLSSNQPLVGLIEAVATHRQPLNRNFGQRGRNMFRQRLAKGVRGAL